MVEVGKKLHKDYADPIFGLIKISQGITMVLLILRTIFLNSKYHYKTNKTNKFLQIYNLKFFQSHVTYFAMFILYLVSTVTAYIIYFNVTDSSHRNIYVESFLYYQRFIITGGFIVLLYTSWHINDILGVGWELLAISLVSVVYLIVYTWAIKGVELGSSEFYDLRRTPFLFFSKASLNSSIIFILLGLPLIWKSTYDRNHNSGKSPVARSSISPRSSIQHRELVIELFNDPVKFTELRKVAIKVFSVELVDFILIVREFKESYGQLIDQKNNNINDNNNGLIEGIKRNRKTLVVLDNPKKITYIYDEFIKPGGPNEINIKGSTRKNIGKKVALLGTTENLGDMKEDLRNIFDESEKECIDLIGRNMLPKLISK